MLIRHESTIVFIRFSITLAHEDKGVIEIKNPNTEDGSIEPSKHFTFDAVFSGDCSQKHLYDVCAAPVVQAVLEGYNGTVFAYGQTGAGKVKQKCISLYSYILQINARCDYLFIYLCLLILPFFFFF